MQIKSPCRNSSPFLDLPHFHKHCGVSPLDCILETTFFFKDYKDKNFTFHRYFILIFVYFFQQQPVVGWSNCPVWWKLNPEF